MPFDEKKLQALRRQEYQLRLTVEQLRREVYAQPIPTVPPDLLKDLAVAEKALAEAEANRASVEREDPDRGLIWHATGWGAAGAPSALLGAATTGLEAEVRLCMEHVPTSLCHLFTRDEHPLVSCAVHNHDTGKARRVRVIAEVEGYSAKAVDSAELAKRGMKDNQNRELDRHTFKLLPTFFPERIKPVTELTRATVNVLVQDLDGQIEQHRTVPIWLLARTTAPTAVKDPTTGEFRDLSRYLGAYVTPNAPSLIKYLRTAARYHPDGRLPGYQKGAADVDSQVKAIYDALKDDADITYVNSKIDFSPDLGTRSQRVRLPRESLDHREANCIDGTVLFASLLEGISLSAALVILPGHAIVAWQKDPDTEEWSYLETTMIGTHAFQEAKKEGETKAKFYEEMADGTANPNFFRRWPLGELRTEHGITPME